MVLLLAAGFPSENPAPINNNAKNASTAPYRVITVNDGGAISGAVRFAAAYPRPNRIRVSKDNEVCGMRKVSETFIVSKENKGLKNVLITVEGVEAGKAPAPVAEITVEQKGCAYVPHFQVAQMGSEGMNLKILNSDGILHNVHSYHRKRTLFNLAQPKSVKKIGKHLKRPGVVTLKCDVHAWMNAYIVLLKNQPYYAVTDENGHFEIAGVPAGTYTLRAWHEALGEMEKPVTVATDQQADVDFVIQPKSKKK
ncbi:MAG: carboxypeptidase regulatory-like domain-containing protein [bacterium]